MSMLEVGRKAVGREAEEAGREQCSGVTSAPRSLRGNASAGMQLRAIYAPARHRSVPHSSVLGPPCPPGLVDGADHGALRGAKHGERGQWGTVLAGLEVPQKTLGSCQCRRHVLFPTILPVNISMPSQAPYSAHSPRCPRCCAPAGEWARRARGRVMGLNSTSG